MRYQVRATDARDGVLTLELQALDADDALRQARERGCTPLSARALGGIAAQGARPDADLFMQQLHHLLQAGLSTIEALEALIEKEGRDATQMQLLRRLAAGLREGRSLSQALQAQGFDAVLVGVVQAAESTGNVPTALGRYLAYRQRLDTLRQQVQSAVLYPTILLGVGLLVTAFLLGYVVPRFAQVVQSSGRELPWASQALMQAGLWLSAHAAPVALGALLLALLGMWRWRRARQRGGDGLVWLGRLPGLGPRLGLLVLARFYLTLGLLLEGGIAIQSALGLAAQALDAPRRAALQRATEAVATGERLSGALKAARLCTPVAWRLLRAGEQSGQLGPMLGRAAAFHDNETARWIERFSKAFEPLLMAAIGLVVGVIVVLLYLPIFDLASSIG